MNPLPYTLPSLVRNKKRKTLYIASKRVINCTNSVDGQVMVEYRAVCGTTTYVREQAEFAEKFEYVCGWTFRAKHIAIALGLLGVLAYTGLVFGVTYALR